MTGERRDIDARPPSSEARFWFPLVPQLISRVEALLVSSSPIRPEESQFLSLLAARALTLPTSIFRTVANLSFYHCFSLAVTRSRLSLAQPTREFSAFITVSPGQSQRELLAARSSHSRILSFYHCFTRAVTRQPFAAHSVYARILSFYHCFAWAATRRHLAPIQPTANSQLLSLFHPGSHKGSHLPLIQSRRKFSAFITVSAGRSQGSRSTLIQSTRKFSAFINVSGWPSQGAAFCLLSPSATLSAFTNVFPWLAYYRLLEYRCPNYRSRRDGGERRCLKTWAGCHVGTFSRGGSHATITKVPGSCASLVFSRSDDPHQ
jgi:hypothetical protein